MAAINQEINDKVVGDDIRIVRTYSSLPTGVTINKAWLTIKRRRSDADGSAVLGPKSITTSATAAGQITDASTTSDLALGMYFDLLKAETILLEAQRTYYYDVQVKTTTGAIYTCELGTIRLLPGVTAASS